MALPLDRFCNAVLAWVRQQNIEHGEEGRLRWQQVQDHIRTPLRSASVPSAPEKPAGPPRMTPEQEAAAFAAFAAATGG